MGRSRRAVIMIAWSKLIFVGCLFSFFVLALAARQMGDKAIWLSLTIFVGWISFLLAKFVFLSSDGEECDEEKRLPVSIITGFLGCGKTTLVNHILQNESGKRILVIENEIGEESVDHELLLRAPGGRAKEEVIVLSNGCVCCTVRGDLLRALHDLFKRPVFRTLDWVLIETTVLCRVFARAHTHAHKQRNKKTHTHARPVHAHAPCTRTRSHQRTYARAHTRTHNSQTHKLSARGPTVFLREPAPGRPAGRGMIRRSRRGGGDWRDAGREGGSAAERLGRDCRKTRKRLLKDSEGVRIKRLPKDSKETAERLGRDC